MVGIRLDSGDLAPLSIEARRMLDAAGFEDAVIAVIYDELRGGSPDGLLVPAHRERDFARFPEGMKRFENPDRWPVRIE